MEYKGNRVNLGCYRDHNFEGRPVCGCCILGSGHYNDEKEKFCDPSGKAYVKVKNPTKPCWSCVEMIEEGIRKEENRIEFCAYCNRPVCEEEVPDYDDDAEWERLAKSHESDCEWIYTRAFWVD